MRFLSATFGAGVVVTQRPITCPKPQLQSERCGKLTLRWPHTLAKYLSHKELALLVQYALNAGKFVLSGMTSIFKKWGFYYAQ
jgi:hypothetical protein